MQIPFSFILSDLVEVNSDSAQYFFLGAVASKSSLNMKLSAKRLDEGLLKLLKSDVFTVTTVDNIDFLQSNAAVYADLNIEAGMGQVCGLFSLIVG